MSDKRRSFLFPFRAEKKPEAKFEVVNRKRSPLATQATPTPKTAAKPAAKPATTAARTPTPFDDVARKVSASAAPPATQNKTPHQLTTQQHHHKSDKLKAANSIRLTDAPLANLSINGDLPPVPDYNTRSFAPPVTIQGRTVSLAKKDAPPRRKPPTWLSGGDASSSNDVTPVVSSSSLHQPITEVHQVSLSKSSSPDLEPQVSRAQEETEVPHITVQDIDQIREDKPIVFKEKREGGNSINESKESVSQIPIIPGSFPSGPPRSQTPESAPLSKAPLFSPGYIERPNVPGFASPSSNRNSYVSQNSQSEFFDAKEDVERSTPNLVKDTTSTFEEESDEGDYDEDSIVDEGPLLTEPINHQGQQAQSSQVGVSDDFKTIPQSYSIESFANTVESYPISEASQQSSFVVKPLNFHKKTDSSISNTTVTMDSPSTHKKQLSLSDEIMRDIDNFRQGGLQHERLVSEDENDFSPVTPLQMNALGDVPLTIPEYKSKYGILPDEDDDDEASLVPSETPGLRLANAEVEQDEEPEERPTLRVANLDNDKDSLFQDSSEEDVTPKTETTINPIGGLQPPMLTVGDESSRSTSVQPEIDFVQSPVYNYNGKDPTQADESDDDNQSSVYDQFNTVLPRSASYEELYREYTDSEKSGVQVKSYIPGESRSKGLLPDTPTSSARDDTSSYSYHQSPERRTFRVMNDDSSIDKSIASPSRFESDIGDSPVPERRTFHVVNDGQYSDSESDADSFDARASERINQDYSVVHQEDLGLNLNPPAINEESSGDALSFTVRSPINSEFSIGSPPKAPYSGGSITFSDPDLSNSGPVTPQQSIINSDQQSPMHSDYSEPFLTNTPTAQPVYDTRIEEKAAPVQNLGQFQGKSRRPPPGGALAVPTRVARSTSVSAPTNNYNTIQEDEAEATPQTHTPETSSYVEMLRLGAGTTNTNVSAQTWGLPIGIAEIDHSRFINNKVTYKRPSRLQKSDLKHGKIKQRQLALEVGDDEEDDTGLASEKRESTELKRFESVNSLAPSIGSPTMSMTSLSPRKDLTPNGQGSLTRSGTLLTDKLPQIAVNVGRSGTVRDGSKAQMTLFIANPDADSD